ncbi:hypothetical protein [Glaciibacter superstes]|uniref:DUF7882 family protein n=1 Tax=Glaciibacter superstes TaxID=501023 RepID=UPI0003B3D5BF|nr:hypothetical protein [Glaciibacter superstes]
MGKLIYGSAGTEIEFDDRLLAHLKVAIVAKLRRDEKFLLSWSTGSENGGGHESLWMHPAIPLQFIFLGSKQPTLNRAWIEELMISANSTGGLHVLPEPEEPH